MAGMAAALQLLQHAAAGEFQTLLQAAALGLPGIEGRPRLQRRRRGGRFPLFLDRLALPAAGHGSDYTARRPAKTKSRVRKTSNPLAERRFLL